VYVPQTPALNFQKGDFTFLDDLVIHLAENLGKTILLIIDVRGHRDQILVFQRLMDYKRNLPLKNCPLSPEKGTQSLQE
jgi:hypothetical protein